MGLSDSLPPWLSINPRDFVLATQAGVQAGHAIADSVSRAWEENQRMQMANQRAQEEGQQNDIRNAMAQLAADRLEQYRQSEIAHRNAELGIQQQGLGLRGEGLDLRSQRIEDLANAEKDRQSNQLQRMGDLQAQRDFRNEIYRQAQADRDRALDLREKGMDKTPPVHTKIAADEFGPELSGPINDPAIVQRLQQRDAKKAAEAAAHDANPLVKAYRSVFGGPTAAPATTPYGGSIPMNPAYPNPNDVAAPAPSPVSSKVQKAKDLYQKHPNWTKQQVIDAVNSGVE